jgi:hypothetical protein
MVLGVSRQRVVQLCTEGKLRHYRRGGFYEFDLLDVQALKAERDRRPAHRPGRPSLTEKLQAMLA